MRFPPATRPFLLSWTESLTWGVAALLIDLSAQFLIADVQFCGVRHAGEPVHRLPAEPGEDLVEDVVAWCVPAFIIEALGCGDVGGQPVGVGAWHAGVV